MNDRPGKVGRLITLALVLLLVAVALQKAGAQEPPRAGRLHTMCAGYEDNACVRTRWALAGQPVTVDDGLRMVKLSAGGERVHVILRTLNGGDYWGVFVMRDLLGNADAYVIQR